MTLISIMYKKHKKSTGFCNVFNIVPNFILGIILHTEFEIVGTTQTIQKEFKNHYLFHGHTDFLVIIIELLCFLEGSKLLKE